VPYSITVGDRAVYVAGLHSEEYFPRVFLACHCSGTGRNLWNITLSSPLHFFSPPPLVEAEGGRIYLVYTDDSRYPPGVCVAVFDGEGRTVWISQYAGLKVGEGDALAVCGGRLYLAWTGWDPWINFGDVCLARLGREGEEWNTTWGSPEAFECLGGVAADGQAVYLAGTRINAEGTVVFMASFSMGGLPLWNLTLEENWTITGLEAAGGLCMMAGFVQDEWDFVASAILLPSSQLAPQTVVFAVAGLLSSGIAVSAILAIRNRRKKNRGVIGAGTSISSHPQA